MPSQTQDVTLKLEKGYVVAVPNKVANKNIGDKIRFQSDGKFKVEFDRWPFSGKKHPITDRRARAFRSRGPFKFECTILVPSPNPSGGWSETVYKKGAGARGNVKP